MKERVSWLQEVTTFLGAEIETRTAAALRLTADRNRYSVQDRVGNQLFYAIERS